MPCPGGVITSREGGVSWRWKPASLTCIWTAALPAAAGISGWAVRTFQINDVSVECISLPIIRGPCHQSKAPPGWACALPDHRGHGHSEESEAFAQDPPVLRLPFCQHRHQALGEAGGQGRASRRMGRAQTRGHAWSGPRLQSCPKPLLLGGSLWP